MAAAADLNSYLLSTGEGEQDMKLVVPGPGGDRVFAVPRVAVQRLVEVLEALGDGHEPSVVPTMKELSTGDVASLLGVSRQYVVRLIDEGRLPCRRVGNRRRVRLDEALRYLRDDNQRRAGRSRELAPTAS
ncbi:MAG: helix-turn-helix domain-containing protein [Acidimicrobiales bacterium]